MFVDAAVDAAGQAIAAAVDRVDQGVELGAAKAHQEQHRPENLLAQVSQTVDANQRRSGKVAPGLVGGSHAGARQQALAGSPDRGFDLFLGGGIDQRAKIGVQARRFATTQFVHGADEQFGDARSDFLLHTQHTQGRAALSGAIER